jgi:hypothetical protein
MNESNFELIKEIFSIIKQEINEPDDLLNITLNHHYLRSDEFKDEMINMIPKLKQKYKSHVLTCLHKNSLDKQKFPTINMIRQILKCNKYKLEPYIVTKGYDTLNKRKILERYYIIKHIE